MVMPHFSLSKQAQDNGTFDISSILTCSDRQMPNLDVPIYVPRTRIARIDNYFAFMVSFFSIALDRRNEEAHLIGRNLQSTLSSPWLLMLLEAHRNGRPPAFLVATYGRAHR